MKKNNVPKNNSNKQNDSTAIPKSSSVIAVEDKVLHEKINELRKLWTIIKDADLLKESKNAVLSYETSVLVWQFCRKSDKYLDYYDFYIGKGVLNPLGRYIWGFEELIEPGLLIPPKGFQVAFIKVKLLDGRKRQSKIEIEELKVLMEVQKLMGIQSQLFTLFIHENMKWEDVENLLRPQFNKTIAKSIHPVTFNSPTLDKKIICHLIVSLRDEYSLSKKFCLDKYNELVHDGMTMTFTRMQAYSNHFLNISSQAPSIFFRRMK